MTTRDLDRFRRRLLAERTRLTGEIQHLTDGGLCGSAGDSLQPSHLAESGNATYEQEVTARVLSSESNVLQEIEAALVRLEKGLYGLCEHSGKPIPRARLEVIPWTRYCVEHAH